MWKKRNSQEPAKTRPTALDNGKINFDIHIYKKNFNQNKITKDMEEM